MNEFADLNRKEESLVSECLRIEKTMDIQQQSKLLRSQLLKMSRLTQRAVDYSIKAYELERPEFCWHVHNTEYELGNLRCRIADQGRTLLAAGMSVDSDSRFACYALRICSALDITYSAAAKMAHNTLLTLKGGRSIESSQVSSMGKFVNSLVRLYTVALVNEEIQHAKTILLHAGSGPWLVLEHDGAHRGPVHQAGPHANFERAIAKSLVEIAEQACAIADAITSWLEGKNCFSVNRQRTEYVLREM